MPSKRPAKATAARRTRNDPGIRWRCPACDRSFGRPQQSHVCVPGLTLEQYLERQPAAYRPVYRAVLARLARLGDLDVDPVEVGIMIKRARTFCELRPRKRGVELSFKLSRSLAHPRITRVIRYSTHRIAYFVLLERAADIDDELMDWLAESYLDSPR